MSGKCEGKVAIVTGGGSGIGKAAALKFAAEGAAVAVVDRNARSAMKTTTEIRDGGGKCLDIVADVSDSAEVRGAVERAVENFGKLDIAFNAAGVPGPGLLIADIPEDAWADTIAINLTGTFLCMKYQILAMLENGGGSIINMSSAGILKPVWPQPDYQASKAGIVALTRSAALTYGPKNIRVNALLPGVTKTPLLLNAIADDSPEMVRLADMMPLRRIASAEEVANTAVWLSTDDASYVTGLGLVVDGGMQLA